MSVFLSQFKISRTPPLIDNLSLLKQKIEMMEQLMEIGVASSIMDEALRNAKVSIQSIGTRSIGTLNDYDANNDGYE